MYLVEFFVQIEKFFKGTRESRVSGCSRLAVAPLFAAKPASREKHATKVQSYFYRKFILFTSFS